MAELKLAQLYKADKLELKMEALGKSAGKVQAEMHKVACSVLLHFGQHKDTRMIQRFLMLIPDMVRTNGLRAWFEAHAAVKFIVDESGPEPVEQVIYVKDKFKDIKEVIKLGEGMTKPFWKFKANEGTPYQPINEVDYVKMVIDKLRRDTAKTGHGHERLLFALENYDSMPAMPVIAADDPLMIVPTPAVDPVV